MSRKSRKLETILAACGGVIALGLATPQAHAQIIPLTWSYDGAESNTLTTGIDPLNPTVAYLPTQFGDGVSGVNTQFYDRQGPGGTTDTQVNWNASNFFQFSVIVPPNNGATDPSYIPNGPIPFQILFGGDVAGEVVQPGTIPVPTNDPNTAVTMNVPLGPYQPIMAQSATGGYFYMVLLSTYGYNGAYSATNGFPESGSAAAGGPPGGPADGLTFYVGNTQLNSVVVRNAAGTALLDGSEAASTTGNASWTNPSTWYSGGIPSIAGDIANLGAATSDATITMDGAETVGALNFTSANSYELAPGTGGSLTLSGFGGSSATITLPLTAADETISAPVNLVGAATASVGAGLTLDISGNIGGAGSLTTSTGMLLLAGNNTYSGGTTITGGILQIGSPTALGTGPLAANGGTVDLNGNNLTVGGLTGAGTIDNVSAGGNVTLTDIGAGSTFFNGSINNSSGTVNVTFNGGASSLLILAGANNYSGTTTVSSGTLILQNPAALPSGGNVVNNASLAVQAGSLNNPVIAGNISGAGTTSIGGPIDGYLQLNPGTGPDTQGFLTVALGSTLDITDNKMTINYGSAANDPATALVAAIVNGYSAGTWTGAGVDGTSAAITSSTASNDASKFSVGYLDGDAPGETNALQSGFVSANQFKLAYTLTGDAYLEGSVGFDDLVAVAQNFGKTGEDWAGGNFNYDPNGSVGFADLVSVAQNFGQSIGGGVLLGASHGLSPAWQAAQNQSVIPEPTSLALAAVGAAGLLARRRSRKADAK